MTPSVNSIEDAFDRLRRVRWLIVTATLVFGVVGVVMAFTTGKYSASSVLIVQRADTNLLQALSSDVGRMRFNGPDAFIEKFLVYLNSRSFHEAAFADLLHDKNYSRIKKVLVQPRLQQILERLQVFGLPVTISDDAIVADPNVAGSMAGSMRVMRSDSNTIVVTVTTSNREVSAL